MTLLRDGLCIIFVIGRIQAVLALLLVGASRIGLIATTSSSASYPCRDISSTIAFIISYPFVVPLLLVLAIANWASKYSHGLTDYNPEYIPTCPKKSREVAKSCVGRIKIRPIQTQINIVRDNPVFVLQAFIYCRKRFY